MYQFVATDFDKNELCDRSPSLFDVLPFWKPGVHICKIRNQSLEVEVIHIFNILYEHGEIGVNAPLVLEKWSKVNLAGFEDFWIEVEKPLAVGEPYRVNGYLRLDADRVFLGMQTQKIVTVKYTAYLSAACEVEYAC